MHRTGRACFEDAALRAYTLSSNPEACFQPTSPAIYSALPLTLPVAMLAVLPCLHYFLFVKDYYHRNFQLTLLWSCLLAYCTSSHCVSCPLKTISYTSRIHVPQAGQASF